MRIFISYRRGPTTDITGRIHDHLATHFAPESVFRDVDNIPVGVRFPEHLEQALEDCELVLAIIGKDWLQDRLNNPQDFLRRELEYALERRIPVIPVLVGGATVPDPASLPPSLATISDIQAAKVSSEGEFNRHMRFLIESLERLPALEVERKRRLQQRQHADAERRQLAEETERKRQEELALREEIEFAQVRRQALERIAAEEQERQRLLALNQQQAEEHVRMRAEEHALQQSIERERRQLQALQQEQAQERARQVAERAHRAQAQRLRAETLAQELAQSSEAAPPNTAVGAPILPQLHQAAPPLQAALSLDPAQQPPEQETQGARTTTPYSDNSETELSLAPTASSDNAAPAAPTRHVIATRASVTAGVLALVAAVISIVAFRSPSARRYAASAGDTDRLEIDQHWLQCDSHDWTECVILGAMYEQGLRGAPHDGAQAASLYRLACEGGNSLGCTNLGAMYADGTAMAAKDPWRAVELYRKGCDGGSLVGCTNLGVMYADGLVGTSTKDPKRAAELYQKACNGGEMTGCRRLGLAYDDGAGVDKDSGRAFELYQKACDGSDMTGCYNLGVDYQYGVGVVADPKHAAYLYQKVCDSGKSDGCVAARSLGGN